MSPLPWQKVVSEQFWRAQFKVPLAEPEHGPRKLPTSTRPKAAPPQAAPPQAAPAEAAPQVAPAAEKDLLAKGLRLGRGTTSQSLSKLTLRLPSPRPMGC